MAGVTDKPYRHICKSFGAGMMYTEFVSADGIFRGNERTLDYMRFDESERPLGIQIFGQDEGILSEAAHWIESRLHPDLIDINFGCPVPKVTKKGAGSAILKDLNKMEAVAARVVRSVSLPVTVKMRAGWDHNSIIASEAAQLLEGAGIKAITIHPRTAKMQYNGISDWSVIAEVKRSVTIPVIGNGDVFNGPDAVRMLSETGCDGVMVGRAALGSPWIFQQILEYISTGHQTNVSAEQIFTTIRSHLNEMMAYYGVVQAHKLFKSHFAWYSKGLTGSAHYRSQVNRSVDITEMKRIIDDFEILLNNVTVTEPR